MGNTFILAKSPLRFCLTWVESNKDTARMFFRHGLMRLMCEMMMLVWNDSSDQDPIKLAGNLEWNLNEARLLPQPLTNALFVKDLDDATTSTLHFRPLMAVPEGFKYRTVAYEPEAPRLVLSAMDQMKGRSLSEPLICEYVWSGCLGVVSNIVFIFNPIWGRFPFWWNHQQDLFDGPKFL